MSITANSIDAIVSDESYAFEPEPLTPMLEKDRVFPCEVLRFFAGKDPTGGGMSTRRVIGSYRGRLGNINTVRPRESNAAGALFAQSGYILYLPIGADVIPKDRVAVPGLLPQWKPNTDYVKGDMVIPFSNRSGVRRCFTAMSDGYSGTTEPTWSAQKSSIAPDAGLQWRESGIAIMLEIVGLIDQITFGHESLVHVTEVL